MGDSNNEAMISNLQTTIEKYEQANKEQIEKIVNLEEIITEMSQKLTSLENLANENSNLNYELNKQNELIQQKNKTISEFQELAKLSQIKFETFINNNNTNQNVLNKKSQKYSDLKAKYLPLIQQYDNLEREHNKLISESKIEKESKEREIANLNEQLLDITSKYNLSMNDNQKLISEVEQSKNKESELNEKINNLNLIKIEFENVKKEFEELEKELIEKNTKIELLEKFNEELKVKLKEGENIIRNNENYQKQLEEKIDNLNNICGKFENAYNGAVQDLENKKIENENLIKETEEKNSEIQNLKDTFNKQYVSLKNENVILKKRENQYKQTLNKLKSFNEINNPNQGIMNVNNSYYTYNPSRGNELNLSSFEKDDSGKYSYYLIDNLKNTMNKIDLQKN